VEALAGTEDEDAVGERRMEDAGRGVGLSAVGCWRSLLWPGPRLQAG